MEREWKSINEINEMVRNGELRRLRTRLARGYVSRRSTDNDKLAEPYTGRFGSGYKVHTPCWDSTFYHFVTYFVEV